MDFPTDPVAPTLIPEPTNKLDILRTRLGKLKVSNLEYLGEIERLESENNTLQVKNASLFKKLENFDLSRKTHNLYFDNITITMEQEFINLKLNHEEKMKNLKIAVSERKEHIYFLMDLVPTFEMKNKKLHQDIIELANEKFNIDFSNSSPFQLISFLEKSIDNQSFNQIMIDSSQVMPKISAPGKLVRLIDHQLSVAFNTWGLISKRFFLTRDGKGLILMGVDRSKLTYSRKCIICKDWFSDFDSNCRKYLRATSGSLNLGLPDYGIVCDICSISKDLIELI